MKGHTPIKRHESLVAFSRDHHFGLLLVWKIREGLNNEVATERISNYVLYFFDEELERHFRDEEHNLFSKLPLENILRQQAEQEHTKIYTIVNWLREDQANKDLLLQFANALKDHIRFEERELFAYLQQTLPATELEEIARHDGPHAADLDSRWGDIFWNRR